VCQALITLFSDPARKTSPGNTPKWLGSLIYRCGDCNDGTTTTVRHNASGTRRITSSSPAAARVAAPFHPP
jgi:hypothetical protein